MKLTSAGTGWIVDPNVYIMEEYSFDEDEEPDTEGLTEIFVLEAF